jgi:sugar phosphate isomerase/epimerase
MARTAINVYTIRELEESVPAVLDRVAAASYDAVQFSGQHTPIHGDTMEIQRKLDETGLDATGAHIGVDDLEENLDRVVTTYETVGVDDAVVPYLPASAFESATVIEETAARLADLRDTLGTAGWGLHYHNHDHEFVDVGDGSTGFEALIERTDIGIELDVGWALYAGRDPIELIDQYGDRMTHIHMKDVAVDDDRAECFREIGEGDVDMRGCAEAAHEAGVEWLIYEHDNPGDPVASISNGAEFLNTL